MAKTVKKVSASPRRRFIVMRSDCGSFEQLTTDCCYNPDEGHATVADAKKAAADDIEAITQDCGTPSKMFILEIVAEGTPTGIEWK